jgi:polyhydroxybutyrate depolymerase
MPAAVAASAEAPPLLIVLHGYASSAREFAANAGLSDRADASGVVVAYPQGLGSPAGWHFTGSPSDPVARQTDIALFDALVDLLVDAGCAEPARVFVAGHSQGGGMTSELACRRGDRIAGIAIVSAEVFSLACTQSRPVAVVSLHAVDDEVLPYDGGRVANMPTDFPRMVAAEDVASAWASHNGCLRGPNQSPVRNGDLPTRAGVEEAGRDGVVNNGGSDAGVPDDVVRFDWDGCAAPVTFYRLPSGGHAWSGGANLTGVGLSQSALVWRFLFPSPPS